VPFSALEISRHITPAEACQKFPSSKISVNPERDVHRLSEFLGATVLELAAPTVAELKLAFGQQAGRSLRLTPAKS